MLNLENTVLPKRGSDNSLGSGTISSSSVLPSPEPNLIVVKRVVGLCRLTNLLGADNTSKFIGTKHQIDPGFYPGAVYISYIPNGCTAIGP